MKIKTIITGATGMVGEGVLHECLLQPEVKSVLVINRKPCGVKHEKLKEIIHKDFFDLASIEDQLTGYNACYFCAGVSSVGKKEDEYERITYDLTMYVANILLEQNPEMTFCYVSGLGTDSTEKVKSMWARVKGKTENDLLKLPFKSVYMFRPGYIQPTKGLKNTFMVYKLGSPFYPLWKTLFPKFVCTLEQLGKSMINVSLYNPNIKILNCMEIVRESSR